MRSALAVSWIALASPVAGQAAPEGNDGLTPEGRPASQTRTAFVMGTRLDMDLRVPGGRDRDGQLRASEAVLREVTRMEELLSTWRPHTPLAQVNRGAVGAAVPIPTELLGLLETALAWSVETGGAFDPRIGALVDAWDLRGAGRIPDPAALRRALAASGESGAALEAGGVVRRDPSAWIDAGAFGKGAALEGVPDLLRAHGVESARLNLGGQLLLVGAPGTPDPEGGWPVAVAHPHRRHEPAAWLRVRNASVATSGASERGIEVEGRRFGHLLDPRNGWPAPAWGSVTVVSQDPLVADILSTALFVLGPDAGMPVAANLDQVGVLFLIPSPAGLQARWNPAMDRWLTDESADLLHNDNDPGATGALQLPISR